MTVFFARHYPATGCSASLRRHGAIARVRAAISVTHAAHKSGNGALGHGVPRAKVN
jgi:hypothetical protein